MTDSYDVAIVGGGWFGCAIADFLKDRYAKIVILEREPATMQRASLSNQARIHNGYHYPRSLQTAYRSHMNFKQFARDYADCVVNDFTKLYCVARQSSKVSPLQFERFCNLIGAPWKRAEQQYLDLFESRLIEAVYEVEEFVFDSEVLASMLQDRLARAGIELRLSAEVIGASADGESTRLALSTGNEVSARIVFNCTYSGLKRVPGLAQFCSSGLKHEIAELALIEPTPPLKKLAVTVMDGPFFSTMPFPTRNLYTLSHVRYTPHGSWVEEAGGPGKGEKAPDPYAMLERYSKESRALQMKLDAARFMPELRKCAIVDSIFEVKTVLVRNEVDDGRPILIERSSSPQVVYSILGGKLDNIYDVMEKLQADGI
jgi:glycine/D-amino acid oxidase-like deaminating enzyme